MFDKMKKKEILCHQRNLGFESFGPSPKAAIYTAWIKEGAMAGPLPALPDQGQKNKTSFSPCLLGKAWKFRAGVADLLEQYFHSQANSLSRNLFLNRYLLLKFLIFAFSIVTHVV